MLRQRQPDQGANGRRPNDVLNMPMNLIVQFSERLLRFAQPGLSDGPEALARLFQWLKAAKPWP
jgi:hypothetical protein